MDAFVCGQRWVSLTEPALGLGLVVQVELRQLQVLFPAGGEIRRYATESAPLKRAALSVGDTVRDQAGNSFVVESVSSTDGLLIYHGGGVSLPEAALADDISDAGPLARMLTGHTDSSALFDLRLQTLKYSHQSRKSDLRGYTGARIDLLPHQLYIAQEVSRRRVPRVLLADEVGLGKTIEACLILHRMIVCGSAKRILILLPDALIHQWFVELLRRFNLVFSVFDEERCQAMETQENPFLDEQFVICGIDFLLNDMKRAGQALAAEWDMVVVDEAHHLRWSADEPSMEYLLVERFAATVPGLLLLTASPEQTGPESHFARLRLLDPHRYPDLDQFIAEHKQYAAIAAKAAEVIKSGDEAELKRMLDRYGPGRVMFRNSRNAISGFPKRIPHIAPLDAAGDIDARVLWLVEFLRKNSTEKVLVICRAAEDVIALEDQLRSRMGIDVAGFHENMPLIQCDRQAAWFAEPEGSSVLITSGMGGEGRNYQFASRMVLMDIPEDPELIEQRIGRLDRIGQQNDIHIYVPYIKGSKLEGLVRWLHEGLDAFSVPLVGGYRMYLEFGNRLQNVDNKLIAETRAAHDQLRQEIRDGRNLLLELSSCRPGIAAKLVKAIKAEESNPELENYMSEVFEHFGVDAEPLGERNYLLSADMLFCEEFPLPRERGAMQISYDREYALTRPTVTLISWDHPMVQGAVDLILGSDRGNCAFVHGISIESPVLQAVYVLEVVASQRSEVERFLPPTPVLIQIDQNMQEFSAMPKIESDAESWQLADDAELRQELLPAMVAASQKLAEAKVPHILKDAEKLLHKELGAELVRMQELKKINDHIRDEEIIAAKNQLTNFTKAIRNARLRLDSLRLVV